MLLLTGRSSAAALGREAMSPYSAGLDPKDAPSPAAGVCRANPRCAIVARHSCTSAAAYQIFEKASRFSVRAGEGGGRVEPRVSRGPDGPAQLARALMWRTLISTWRRVFRPDV